MFRIIRSEKVRAVYCGDKRIFLTTIGHYWGNCTEEAAEHNMQDFLKEWGIEEANSETLVYKPSCKR